LATTTTAPQSLYDKGTRVPQHIMFAGASGFYNAPLLKFITFSTGIATLIPFPFKKHLELTTLESLLPGHLEVWRLITNNFFFTSALEGMLGIFLLYHFRLFERQMGSSKFAAFVTTTWSVSALVTVAGFAIFNPSRGHSAPGPYPLIFALLVQYYFEVPATYRFRFLGLTGSNKIAIYLVGLQLLGSRFGLNPVSLILGLSGIIAGLAYRSDVLPLKRVAFPQFLVRFATKYIFPLLQQARRPTANRNVNMNAPRPPNPLRQAPAVVPPAESDVTALMDLGFSREAAIGALRNANNNTQLAAALLLDPS